MTEDQKRRLRKALAHLVLSFVGQAAFLLAMLIVILSCIDAPEVMKGNAAYEMLSTSGWYAVPAFVVWATTVFARLAVDES